MEVLCEKYFQAPTASPKLEKIIHFLGYGLSKMKRGNYMTKKKKIGIIFVIIVLFIGGYAYKQYHTKINQQYFFAEQIYGVIPTADGVRFYEFLTKPSDVKKVLKDPPPIEMNGYKGLYITAMAYEYYTGETVDYLDIRKKMNAGKIEEVWEEYMPFIEWLRANSDIQLDCSYAVIALGKKDRIYTNSYSPYEEYQKIIELHSKEDFDAYFAEQANNYTSLSQ